MQTKKRILIVLTGGTICSTESAYGKSQSNAAFTGSYLGNDFLRSASPVAGQIDLEYRALPTDILSENMTPRVWNSLLAVFREEGLWSRYEGVIVLHGTDTLAYTASMLAVALSGAPIPVMLVSAQLPLLRKVDIPEGGVKKEQVVREERSNGYANFRAAVELILGGIAPNVYAVYRNMPTAECPSGEMLVHLGARLLQCPNYSNDFHSRGEHRLAEGATWQGVPFPGREMLLDQIGPFINNVLLLHPFVGLSYARFSLRRIKAVVHGTYHSDTVCVERKDRSESEYSVYSVLSLLDRCRERDIPLILGPCSAEAYAYDSTGDALASGAQFLSDVTLELAYTKTMIGVAMGLEGKALIDFLRTPCCGEFPELA